VELTRIAFLALVVLVALLRLVELRVSRRNQRRLLARGATHAPDPSFRWMVLLHAGVLAGAAAEVWFLRRPFLPALAVSMGVLFLAANALRWWVIRTLGGRWSVEVINAGTMAPVTAGPYRYVRHPNYLAVFIEMLSLPLIHTAWLTAGIGTAAHVLVLRARVRAEDAVLLANPEYRARLGNKPRFLPRLFPGPPTGKRPAVPGSPAR
jgi:methyltransferase